MPGLRAELVVDEPVNCPVAAAAAATGTRARSVSWTTTGDGGAVEEFELDGTGEGGPTGVDAPDAEVEPVFDHDGGTVYRLRRSSDEACVCERIERLGCPITRARAADGRLHVTLHAVDADELRTVVTELREAVGDVELRYLVRTDGGDASGDDPVVVDRGRLTDRQREVLRTAHAMGYFDYPREANATEVAAALGIDQSTLAEHLAAAQSKLFDAVVDAPPERDGT